MIRSIRLASRGCHQNGDRPIFVFNPVLMGPVLSTARRNQLSHEAQVGALIKEALRYKCYFEFRDRLGESESFIIEEKMSRLAVIFTFERPRKMTEIEQSLNIRIYRNW